MKADIPIVVLRNWKTSQSYPLARLISSWILMLILTLPIFSQILPLKTYTVKEGLLSNNIEAIAQDSRGYMWFGTTDGVSVFDGKTFTNYTSKDGLPHSFIRQILSDKFSFGKMWILAGDKVCSFVDGEFTTFNTIEETIISLYQDSKGKIWCATNYGAKIIDGDSVRSFAPSFLQNGYKEMIEVNDSTLCFALDRSLIIYHTNNKSTTTIQISNKPYETFHTMKKDFENTLWLTKGWGGILEIQDTTIMSEREGYDISGQIQHFSSNIFDVRGKEIWLHGYNGITRITTSNIATTPAITYTAENGLPENTIRSAFFDREGNLWIGGRDYGVSKISDWNILRFPLGSVWFVHHHQFAGADSNNHLWVIANEQL